ncbi:MAG TPA: hypothetical protein VG637_06580 [Actinomycetes bacterium]|nr:hypothetical protein [Actinomycetes bacterium]
MTGRRRPCGLRFRTVPRRSCGLRFRSAGRSPTVGVLNDLGRARGRFRLGRRDGSGVDVVGQGAVGEEGGAAQGAQLARVEAAEG